MKTTAKALLKRATRARWFHAVVLTRVIVGALMLSGCVSATAYEQANSATDVEREGRHRALVRLENAEAELVRLSGDRDVLAQRLVEEEEAVSASRLDKTTTEKDRDQQTELVTQLRGELALVGEHLKIYADERETLNGEKQALEAELSRAKTNLDDLAPKVEPAVDAVEPAAAAVEPAAAAAAVEPSAGAIENSADAAE